MHLNFPFSRTFGIIFSLISFIEFSPVVYFSYAQTPSYVWTKSYGGINDDFALNAIPDDSGNIYVCGSFKSSSVNFGTTTLTNAYGGVQDVFIIKCDASGNVLWAKRAGGVGEESAQSMAADNSGNLYLTGFFGSTSLVFGSDTLQNSGSSDIFIVKYDPNGNVQWSRSAQGGLADASLSIKADGNGNVFLAGWFNSQILIFGSDTLVNADTSGYADIFITRYDTSGNVLWATNAGGSNFDGAIGIAADDSGNVFITGYFTSLFITFGSTTLFNASSGYSDMFIAKYDQGGNALWAHRAGGPAEELGIGVAADGGGNAIVTGSFYSSTITFGTITLAKTGSYDMFIVKYDASGNVLWADRPVGSKDENSSSIAADIYGNVIVTGAYTSDSLTFGSTILTNYGGNCYGGTCYDFFIVQYDVNGNALWALTAGGNMDDWGNGVFFDDYGDIYIAGSFNSQSIVFGTDTFINNGLYNTSEIVIGKISILTTLGEKSKEKNNLLLYPQPDGGLIPLYSTSSAPLIFEIFDMTGRPVYCHASKGNTGSDFYRLNTQSLTPGIYFMRITGAEINHTSKFVIVK